VKTALRAATRQPRAVTSASVQVVTAVRHAASSILAVQEVQAPSASATVVHVLLYPIQDAWSSTPAPADQDSTDRTVPSSIRVLPRPVSTVRRASIYPESCTRARVRKDTAASSASGGHLVKVVRARTVPHALRPVTLSSAHAQPDISATLVTKVTPVS